MAKKKDQPIAKRSQESMRKNRPQSIKKIREQLCVSGGEHSHWVYDFDKDAKFTEEDGWHNHIFLISGKLYSTERDGSHRHTLSPDGSIGSQTRPHGHDLFITGELHSTELGGSHSHDEPIEENWVPNSGPHRHFVQILGVTYESLLPDDVLSIAIRKELGLGIQSVLFDKARFLTFETAANKAEAMGLSLKKFEERQNNFVFTQFDSSKFKELSLQTITLEDGIEAVIGVLIEAEPESENDLGQSAMTQAPSTEDNEIEESAFEDLQTQMSLGYCVMSETEKEQLQKMLPEIQVNFAAIQAILLKSSHPIINLIDKKIEESQDDNFISLCDRVSSNISVLDKELNGLKFDVTISIEKELDDEITAGTQTGVTSALQTISEFSSTLAEVFKDTSFVNLQKLMKSTWLSSKRFLSTEVNKALIPKDAMTREELRDAQKSRAKKFKIEVVEGSALTFPAGFPTKLADYGDPVNLKFPFESDERARNARVRFKQFANQIYKEEQSKSIVHERIVRKELEFGISVTIDTSDSLDQLLPASLRDSTNVTVIGAAINAVTKNLFFVIQKRSDEERTAFGIVLEPNVVDLQNETYDDETVKNAAHLFMEKFQNIGKQHKQFINDDVKILESYIAPVDMTIDTPAGPVKIKKNTWLMKVRILADDLWEQVKSGEFTGFSIGGIATVTERE